MMPYKLLDEITKDDVDLTSFTPKKSLNPKFWIDDDKMNPSVRRALLMLAKDFITDLDFSIDIEDVIMTGSLANYNWSEEYSDVDLHIVADLSSVDDNYDIIHDYFMYRKRIWNDEHTEIKIMGYPVEIYVQDVNEPHKASGIYSILHDEWINKPSPIDDDPDEEPIKKSAFYYMNIIDELEDDLVSAETDDDFEEVYNKAVETFDEIKQVRKDSMSSKSVEMSTGNLIFKTLRRNGYIEKLLNVRTESYDRLRSL